MLHALSLRCRKVNWPFVQLLLCAVAIYSHTDLHEYRYHHKLLIDSCSIIGRSVLLGKQGGSDVFLTLCLFIIQGISVWAVNDHTWNWN